MSNGRIIYHSYIPVFVRVAAPEGVTVTFSRFHIGDNIIMKDLRGIAIVNIPPDTKVNIQVYVTDDEVEKEVYAYINGEWQPKGGTFQQDRLGIWAGYLETTISEGDPPIAVG